MKRYRFPLDDGHRVTGYELICCADAVREAIETIMVETNDLSLWQRFEFRFVFLQANRILGGIRREMGIP